MSTRTAWIVYSLLRLAFFAIPFAALMLIGWKWWFAAIVATLVAFSLSLIFLSKPREMAAQGVYDWRNRDRTEDDIVEDAAVDGAANALTAQNDSGDPELSAPASGDAQEDSERESDAE